MNDRKENFTCPPRVLGLFQKRIEGDDALLELAKRRFSRAGLGAEFYAETPEELHRLLGFLPREDTLTTVHLPRGVNLLEEEACRFVLRFAEEFKGRLLGMILHDQEEVRNRLDDYRSALERMDASLREIRPGPFLFIEYAVGLDPDLFIRLFEEVRGLERVSACIDTGHLGLYHVRKAYGRKHSGQDVCTLTPVDPVLPDLTGEIQEAVGAALGPVLEVIRGIGRVGKPLHFHLHDGHPLSTFSEFGVSDHLSFLAEIPIPFEYRGKRVFLPMYGPDGLTRMVGEALTWLGEKKVSFSLEIHPTFGRRPLGRDAHLFSHWREKENAERMSHWLAVLEENQRLVLEACEKVRGQRTEDR